MKRFALFAGLDFYPSGGWRDQVGTFDDLASAIASGMATLADVAEWRWAHVVDLTTGETLWEG